LSSLVRTLDSLWPVLLLVSSDSGDDADEGLGRPLLLPILFFVVLMPDSFVRLVDPRVVPFGHCIMGTTCTALFRLTCEARVVMMHAEDRGSVGTSRKAAR
jgi:hypothetical protein